MTVAIPEAFHAPMFQSEPPQSDAGNVRTAQPGPQQLLVQLCKWTELDLVLCHRVPCDAADQQLSGAAISSSAEFRDSGQVVATQHESLGWLPADVVGRVVSTTECATFSSAAGCAVVACPVGSYVAAAVLPRHDSPIPTGATVAAAELCWSQTRLRRWWSERAGRSAANAARELQLATKLWASQAGQTESEQQCETLAEQIDSTYEEISLLHFLAQHQQVSRSTDDLASACLSRMRDSVGCEGVAVWLLGGANQDHFLRDGDFPFDELELAMSIARFDRHPWPQPLVRNYVEEPFVEGGAHIRNLVVVPVMQGEQRIGWVIAVNAFGEREFGTVEASLMQSVALNLGTHLQNAAVVAEQEELLLSFVRSLVSSLDAKDAYTRGHSERVARIARRLAEELELSQNEIDDIYLSGVLHDIGKIGVDDAILGKPGRLTNDEFAEIQKHPVIGYHILSGIKRLRHILPGVRSHHEAIDGTGYPDGLAGDEIPMMARVLAVADSYDAMGSDRPYRNGMPLEKLESILRDGRGKQWDAEVIDAYFRCRDDITRICVDWTARQPG